MIRLHNTLTRKKDAFKSREDKKLLMYVCGPTVYDSPHIGHARAAYTFAMMRNYFCTSGYEVKYIRNVTDIDDKIIERAKLSLKDKGAQINKESMLVECAALSGKYLAEYDEAMRLLGIDAPDISPKATEYMDEIIRFIESLIAKGLAYESEGSVYFKVKSFSGYGKLSRQNLDQMRQSQGTALGLKKEDVLDFALWKKSKPEEPAWESPWSAGRPGWHIECSAMSRACGADTLDIHGGGLDLIFPHHENEIAQSESLLEKPLANYWIHSGLLTIEGQKMAKSLGNFITVNDFIGQNGTEGPDILKLIFLKSHYKSAVNYSKTALEEAKEVWEKFDIFFKRQQKEILGAETVNGEECGEYCMEIEKILKKFGAAMDDDFNTPEALAALYEAMHYVNKTADSGKLTPEVNAQLFAFAAGEIQKLCRDIFGIFRDLDQAVSEENTLSDQIEEKIKERISAKASKDYARADQIRNELIEEYGIQLEDTKDGQTIWRKHLG